MSDGPFGAFELGFREFYRIVIPGYVSLGILILFIPNLNDLDLLVKIVLGFFLGLLSYSFKISQNFPVYKQAFDKQTKRLHNAIFETCDIDNQTIDPHKSKGIYSYFLERFTQANLRERIYYFTSFYYMFTDVSLILLLYGLLYLFTALCGIFFSDVLVQILSFFGLTLMFSSTQLLVISIGLIILSIPSGYGGFRIYRGIIDEQIVIVREEFKDHCDLLISAASSKETKAEGKKLQKDKDSMAFICDMAIQKTKEALKAIILDPDTNYQVNNCEVIETIDWRDGKPLTIFRVEVKTDNKLFVMGSPGEYKGLYKESIETRLNDFLVKINKKYRATIDVSGESKSIHKIIRLDKAIDCGVISQESPVYKTASKLELPHIVIRGRHVIGPNPGLAEIVADAISADGCETVLDLFGGTGAVSKVALSKGITNVTSVDWVSANEITDALRDYSDKLKVLNCDVFQYLENLDDSVIFDLIVADPDFEDDINLIKKFGLQIQKHCKKFIFCQGLAADKTWNNMVKESLINLGFEVRTLEKYGQVFSICSHKNSIQSSR